MNRLILVTVFFLAGCTDKTVPVNKLGPEAQVEKPSVQPQKFSAGEVLYINNCSDCHGWEGRGNGQAAKLMGISAPILLHEELVTEKSENKFVDWVLSGKALKLQLAENTSPQTKEEFTALLTYLKKLPTVDWEEIDAGQQVYDGLCVNCHGLYGHGDGGLASQIPGPLKDISNFDYQQKHSDAELQQIIAKGRGAMPGNEDVLNREEIKSVTAFVRFLTPGYEKYDRFCAGCHGLDGSPVEIVALSEDEREDIGFESIDMPTFDDAYFKSHTDQQIIVKIQHMWEQEAITMPHFAEQLKPDQVRAIFRYLRSLIAEYP